MSFAKSPLALRLPMRVVSRISAVGSGAAFALLFAFLDQVGVNGSRLRTHGTGALSPGAVAIFLGVCIASAFALRWQPKKVELEAVKLATPVALCSLLGGLDSFDYAYGWRDDALVFGLAGLFNPAYLALAIFMLFLVGIPLAVAQRRARLGLAGQERGEAFVAIVSLLMAVPVALPWIAGWLAGLPRLQHAGASTFALLAIAAFVANLVALALACFRSLGRSSFIRRVEDGLEPAFRIDDTVKGPALVRVAKQGEGYRVADLTETLLELRNIDATDAPRHPAGSARRLTLDPEQNTTR